MKFLQTITRKGSEEWKMKNEEWRMKNEKWWMKNEEWRISLFATIKNEPVIPKRSEESQASTCKTKIVIPTRHLYLFYDMCYLIF